MFTSRHVDPCEA